MGSTSQFVHPPDQGDHSSDWALLYALGCMEESERAAFEAHLQTKCAICREQLDEFAGVIAAFAEHGAGAAPRPEARTRFLAAIKGDAVEGADPSIILQRPGLLISRPSASQWEQAGPGIASKVLAVDEKRHYQSVLVRLDPGVHYPRHKHSDVEELFVLQGDLRLEGTVMYAGDYCRAEPGTTHGESFTNEGCLMLLSSSLEDEVLG